MTRKKVGVVNVTGYAGMELARLLAGHDGVELVSVTGRSVAGQKLADCLPYLEGLDLTITAEPGNVDLAFLALPHSESACEAARLLKEGVKVVDISADFRLKNAALYPEWYGFTHPFPDLLQSAVYGLPELYRGQIRPAELVANPGCYPAAAILALAPVLKEGIIAGSIVIDAKSGLSGAGRSLSLKSHYCEANENVTAYALEGHRHLPEIIQEFALAASTEAPEVTFVPHLVPATRGILASCYARVKKEISPVGLKELYNSYYRSEPFIRVVDEAPHTKRAAGTNLCLIYPVIDKRSGCLVVISAIDNLVKGAAGQAVQNMNLMFGFEETAGLKAIAAYP